MRKKILLMTFLTLLLTAMGTGALYAQDNVVTIGTEEGGYTPALSNCVPIRNNYEQSISQQYYWANEIGKTSGTITSVSFMAGPQNGTSTDGIDDYPTTRSLEVYMKNVDETCFNTISDGSLDKTMITLSTNDLVFSGNITFIAEQWNDIEIPNGFEYDGRNILLCVVDKTSSYISGVDAFFKCFEWMEIMEINQQNSVNVSRSLYKTNTSKTAHFNPTSAIDKCSQSFNVPCVQFTFEVPTQFEGEGTEESPYIIADIDDLSNLRNKVNEGETYVGKYFKLTEDITLTGEWTPIGNGSRSSSTYTGNAFKGVFDGNEKTIDGLNIANGSSDETKGLFGVVDGGTVKNLKLTNVDISTSSKNVGAAAGLMVNNATIDKVEVSGTLEAPDGVGGIVGRMIIDGTISNCTNNAEVTATTAAGGIVGKAYYSALNKTMNITDCTNKGNITGSYAAGGIAALSAANISGCSNIAVIASNEAGGIVGEQIMYGTINNNVNSGLIKNINNDGFAHGGIIGWVRYHESTTNYPLNGIINVTNNTNTANIEATGAAGGSGGIVGHIYNQANVTGNTNKAEHIYGGAFAAGIAGSLQQENNNLDIENTTITVSNNISLTSIENITVAGLCKNLFAYNNDAANFVVKDNLSNPPVAQIGDVAYETLQDAFDAVLDGETITLIDDVTVSVATAAYNDGTYIDGVRYTGDKSFTVDFKGKTVTDDGCVNDYLIYINNKGEKASEITFTNGTIVSANGCWSAVCVNSSAATQNVELNLNGMNITNSNDADYSGNPVVRVRTLATVNVNDGTTITSNGASYGVAANTDGSTININEGATIVQQNSGTTAGNSVFAAVGGKGVINIKGGTITSDKFGVHTMTTGTPVINISGGTITAPVALKSSTNGGNGELATINVTGGTINGTLETYTDNGKIVVSGGTFSVDPSDYCADGFVPVENADGTFGVEKAPVASINGTKYTSLAEAVAAAQAGDEIVLIADVTTADGVVITDKNLTIDLNGKTYTVTEGASTNNRNFKINGTSVVTVKNGTMVAAGEYSSGAYGTIRTEGTANVTLTGLKLYNYRGNGLNIKACTGTTVTIENTEIYANYGGGIESAGGTIVVNNGVTVEQKGMYTAPYNSMAISVNGGGKVTVNGGTFSTECITAEEANNQGTSHGPWVAGVLNSGGTLIINDGTFSNDNFGENSLATYARGAILADTKAKVEIYGGTFNVLKNVIDIQNNLGDTNNNPSVLLAGGTYSADPTISAQYGSNLITLAEDYVAVENNDVWNVVKAAAKIGETKYATLEEAIDAAKDGEEIDLLKSVELTSTLLLTKNNILDGNGFRLTPAEDFTPDGNGAVIVLAANMSGYEANRTYTVKNLIIAEFSTPSRIVRANFCNATIQNCSFVNNNSESIITSAYAVLNVENNTFTDNTASFAVINVGSDVSDGTALVAEITGNKFYNNEAAIAGIFLASSADVTDNHFKDNTHTGANANAAAILAGPYTGSMAYTVNINSNAFENAMSKDGTALPSVFAEDWSANYGSTTSFDLSLNYWDGNEPEAGTAYKTSGENPQVTVKSYYTTYTNKTLGGLIEYPQGDKPHAYVSETTIWGQTWTNAKESYVIKVLNAENEVMGTSALNTNLDVTMDGDVEVTWHITLPGITDEDQYWIQEWIAQPNVNNMPAKVELWVDGVKVNEGPVQFNGPDNINKIYAATADAEGKLIRFYNSIETIVNNEENVNVVLVRDVTGSFETFHNVTLYSGVEGGASITNTYSADYTNFNKVIVKNGVTLNMDNVLSETTESVNTIEGTMNVVKVYYHSSDAKTEIKNGGKVTTGGMTIVRYNNNPESGIYIYGDGDDATIEFSCQGDAIGAYSGTFYAEDAVVETKGLRLDFKKENSEELDVYAQINAQFVDTKLSVSSELRLYKDAALTLNGATVTAGKVQIRQNATPTINIENSTIKANSVENLTGATWNAVMDEDGYVTFVRTGLVGEGTEANPYLINNLEDLVFFRDQVNGGNNYAGKHVKLADNIDLSSIENWTPIGDITYDNKYQPADNTKVFSGVFNGNDKVISNLTINRTVGGADTQANVGLFGITGEGSVIKNLTLSDVNITTDGRNVGALAGFAYKATLDNITVNGKININGGNNVSGVAGMTRYHAMSATNIKVIGNDDSAIVGNNIVGGIFAEIAPNGSVQTFENLSVENVAITGASGVGGIVGLLTTGAVDNVTVKNVVLTGRTDYQGNAMGRIRLGSIAGLMGGQYATIANVTVENVTAMNLDNNQIEDLPIIGANYDASSNATEAKIGDTYYATLAKAYDAAEANQTITILSNIETSELIKVEKSVVIDLNGKTVTANCKKAFEVYANATIKNGAIEAAQRCVDTRKAVELTLTDVTLIADEYTTHGNPQPLTIGGSENGTKVVMTNVNISAADGYGIITFVETELTATISTIGGYNALYVKPGSDNSTFNFVDSDLSGSTVGNDVEGNSFSTIAVRANNVAVNVDAESTVTANGNHCYAISFKSSSQNEAATGSRVTVEGEITGNILDAAPNGNTVKVKAEYADDLLAEGYATTEADANDLVEVSGLAEAKIGDNYYETLADAATAAQDGETIQLIWAEGNDPISMAASFYGKNVTITGTATVDWSKGNLFIGRGGVGNATLTFNGANLTSASDNASTGIHVSGREKNTNNKYDGTVNINNSTIELDYLINKGTMTLDNNSTLTVKNGFSIGGRPASETESGEDATATITLSNNSRVVVNKHNGMGLGYEAIGVMNIDATSTFETTQAFLVTAKGTMNNAGTVEITGTLTNEGNINFTDDAATLATTTEDLTINYNLDPDKKVAYIDGVYKVVDKVYVAQIGEDNKFETLHEAFDAAQDGDEIVVLKDIVLTEGITVAADKTVALDLNGKTITGTPAEAKAFAVITNKGNLTITDGTETEGKIVCDHKLAGSTGYAVNTITNSGTLTIVASTIQNTSTASNQIGYAIDNNSTTGNTILVIEGDSKVTASGSGYYDGIRQFCNSETNENSVTIKGGEVSSLWLQNPSDGSGTQNTKDVKGSFAINGGTLNNLYLEPSTQFAGAITGGHVGNISRFQTAEGRDLEGFITGGTFSVDPTAYCAQGYSAKDNEDGTYSVIMTSGTQEIALALGWNWFSSYIDLSGETGLEKVQTALGTNGVQIKGKFNNNSSSYQDLGNGTSAWIGDFDLSTKQMYMINTSADVTMEITGNVVDREETTISLGAGWNWISYPLYETVDINEALANHNTAADGDAIKTLDKTSVYYSTLDKWIGDLTELTPGQGYMYKSANATSFVYSAGSSRSAKSDAVSENKFWKSNANKFANNMTVVAMLSIDGEIVNDNYEIAAFANGECRGSARPVYVEELDQYILFLTINGEDVQELTFKYYDVNYGTVYELNNRINYSNDAVLGSIDEPYMFNLGILNIEEATLSDINIYPNPTTTGKEINLEATCDKVEVFNALGVKVAEYSNVDSIDALETAGIYVIRVTIDGDARNCRLVVK